MNPSDESPSPKSIVDLLKEKESRWGYASPSETSAAPQNQVGGHLDFDLMYSRIFFGLGRYFRLTPSESNLLAFIHSLSKDGKAWCYMSQESMAAALNITIQTVNAHLEKLGPDDMDLLEKGPRHPRWKTIQWRLGPKALDRLRYIEEQIAKRARLKKS